MKVFCLVGASGVGKSSILDYVKNNFNIDVREVSARPFLPAHTDYVNSLDEHSQVLITQNRFVSFIEPLIKNESVFFSRSPIDSLAYEMVLDKAPYIVNLLKRQIEITQDKIQYLYIPIEFEMKDEGDVVRGTNDEVQAKTDEAIRAIFCTFPDIGVVDVYGSLEDRYRIIDEVLKEYKK